MKGAALQAAHAPLTGVAKAGPSFDAPDVPGSNIGANT